MKQSSLDQASLSQSTLCKKRFPLLKSVQKLHERNLRVTQKCKKNSLHSASLYSFSKSQYQKEVIVNHQIHVEKAQDISNQRKKILEERRKQNSKRTQDNLLKFERIMTQKKNQVFIKQKKLMEKSQTIRKQFLKSLNNSFHRSEDKLHHIKQRSKIQFNRSSMLFSQHKQKISAASNRKENYISDLKQFLREKNQQILVAKKDSNIKNREIQERYIQQLISKLTKAEKKQLQRNQKKNKELSQKRKQDEKQKEKYLKKRCLLQENTQKKREYLARQSSQKSQKAQQLKVSRLALITNTLQNKRKQKQLQVKQNLQHSWRENESKVQYLNEKHQHSKQLLQVYRQELEQLRKQNLADSYLAIRK